MCAAQGLTRLQDMTTQLERDRSHPHSIARVLAVVEAAAAALVIWAVGWLWSVPFTIRSNGSDQTIGATSVTVVAVLAGLAAWASLALLERFVARPRRFWTFLATGILALSLLGPAGQAVGTSTTVTLLLMHLSVGAVLIFELRRQSSR